MKLNELHLLGRQVAWSTLRENITRNELEELSCIEETISAARLYAEAKYENMAIATRCKEGGISIVSLGEGCLPRILLTRWGLKLPKRLGEKSYPFDLSVHQAWHTAAILENCFDGYLDPAHLEVRTLTNSIMNTKYRIHFNHETASEFAPSEFRKFIERYSARIDNLYSDIKASKLVLFVIHNNFSSPEVFSKALLRLNQVVPSFIGQKSYSIFALNTSSSPVDVPGFSRIDRSGERPSLTKNLIYNAGLPFPGYTFYNQSQILTIEAVRWEKDIANLIKWLLVSSL